MVLQPKDGESGSVISYERAAYHWDMVRWAIRPNICAIWLGASCLHEESTLPAVSTGGYTAVVGEEARRAQIHNLALWTCHCNMIRFRRARIFPTWLSTQIHGTIHIRISPVYIEGVKSALKTRSTLTFPLDVDGHFQNPIHVYCRFAPNLRHV